MLATHSTGLIGFDFGAASVKAAQIIRKNGAYRLRSAAIVPRRKRWTPEALADGPARSSTDELATAASMCDALSGGDAAAMFPMALCDVLQLPLPAVKRTGLPDLYRAVEAETHRAVADRVIDYWPVKLHSGKVNVVSASLAWSDQISADVAAAGWHCRMIDALPWALARAVSLVESPEATRPVVALDWGFGKATLTLVHQGTPVLIRCLKDCSFSNVLRAIERGLRLDAPAAEALLHRQGIASAEGVPSATAAAISEVLAEPLETIAREMLRTFSYWEGASGGLAPQMIYLFGGGASMAGVEERLSASLGMEVRTWRLPVDESADADSMPPAYLLGPAIGLSAAAWETL